MKYASITKNKEGFGVIKIKFPFDYAEVNRVRTIPQRQYHKQQFCWSVPLLAENVKTLLSWGYILDKSLEDWYAGNNAPKPSIFKPIPIPGLKGTLMPFQEIGVSMIESKNGRVLLADEMGLGKTVQALAWLQLHKECRPTLIITPASLKYNWKNEVRKWLPVSKVQVINSTNQDTELIGKIIIINYDILSFWYKKLIKYNFKILIADECHYFKNNEAIRTKLVKKIAKNIPKIIALSGTALENRPLDIYNAWKIIDPENCPPFVTFGNLYCGGSFVDYKGATNLSELHNILKKTILIRRLKKDVLPELPDKQKTIIPIQIDNRSAYDAEEQKFIKYLKTHKKDNTEIFSFIEKLQQLSSKGKLKSIIEWVSDFLVSDKKLVIFVTHRFMITSIISAFPESLVYDGSVNLEKREKIIQEFQTNPSKKIFIGMLDNQGKPAGVGITLTAASDTITTEYRYTPSVHDQADDRVHRIGQKNAVNNRYFLAINTIEEKIFAIQDKKRIISDKVLDGINTDSKSLLLEIFKFYKN